MLLSNDVGWFIGISFSPGNLGIITIDQSEHLFWEVDICIRELLEEESLEVDDPSSF